ncbi:uncharacterized protein LOC111069350 [Drosophila obscura]|uniref:uncharacterized protein LOC111069350 n=1 Tax=Drosophila obscura TaxID=7282 RepID=UPI001BB1E971|nr:uncharacterized protein LOC111069350 [Drosophila obscura]
MSGRDDARRTWQLNPSQATELWGRPNTCGQELSSVECWLLHPVAREDTMASLALKYDTSIGKICRANRMQWQDVLLARRHVWVPVRLQRDTATATELTKRLGNGPHPTHCHRQSSANTDDFARDRDPLLITNQPQFD